MVAAARRPARKPRRKRPRKYSQRVHDRIVKAIREGAYFGDAFRLAGIHRNTGFEWLRLGRDKPELHPEYAQLGLDIEQADAEYIEEMLGHVNAAARSRKPNTWPAAMTALERRYPDRFSRRETTVIEGGQTPLEVKAGVLTHLMIMDPEARELGLKFLSRVANLKRRELDRSPAERELEAP
jgi:hypothetical protein